ncbi:MAG: TlpA disulfide reductase family protein [Pirellulales bacterium]
MARNRARTVTCPAIALALASAALVMFTTGCGKGGAKLPAASVPGAADSADKAAEKSPPSGVDAQSLLAEVVAKYQQAKSYEDAGDLHLEFATADGQKQTSPAFPFSVAFERPNKVRVHALEASVLGDGTRLYASVNSLEGQVLVRPDPEKLTLGELQSDEMLVQAMRGQIGVKLPQLDLLLVDDPIRSLAGDGTPQLLPDEEFLGQRCHRVAIEGAEGTSVFWIHPDTKLLVKFDFPTVAFAKEYSLSEAKISADFKGAEIDAPIDATAFKFDLPAGAKLLNRFLPPPPDAPSPLLGQKTPEFSFVDYRGGDATQDSLAGKVVVLDMWATWCGWCFEGFPNLQKVNDQFQGNDKVVILAVNTDEVTMTDEQVQASFAKAKLTIPIVRDTKQAAGDVFQVQGLPTMVILGPDGTVQDYHIGYDANLAATLPGKIERLLAGESLAKEELEKYQQKLAEYQKMEAEAVVADAGSNID